MEKYQEQIKKLAAEMAEFYGEKRAERLEDDLYFLKHLPASCRRKIEDSGEIYICQNDDRLVIPGFCSGSGCPSGRFWYFSKFSELYKIVEKYWEILIPKNPEFYEKIILDWLEDGGEPEDFNYEQYDCLAPWVKERNGLFCFYCEDMGGCQGV